MVNFKKVITGVGVFILMFFLTYVTQYIIPPLIDMMSSWFTSIGASTTVAGIMWFGLVLVWVCGMLIIPNAIIIWGITEESDMQNAVLGYAVGILYSLFSIAIFYFAWYMVTPLAEAFLYPLLLALFWMSLISLWVMNVIVVPTYVILESKRG